MNNYLGEIRVFGGNYAPVDWHLCDGSLIPISVNPPLFSLIGITYGGDGVSTFALPDLRGRLDVGQGSGAGLTPRILGKSSGSETAVLDATTMQSHNHTINTAGTEATTATAGAGVTFANTTGQNVMYVNAAATPAPSKVSPHPVTIANAGGTSPHDNIMPSLAVNYIIALHGLYPQAA